MTIINSKKFQSNTNAIVVPAPVAIVCPVKWEYYMNYICIVTDNEIESGILVHIIFRLVEEFSNAEKE